MAQAKVQKTEEYRMYFRFYELCDWVKRSGSCRRRFIQRFLKRNYRLELMLEVMSRMLFCMFWSPFFRATSTLRMA